MKTSLLKISALTLGLSFLPVAGFGAQPATTSAPMATPLGLLRLQDTTKPGDAVKLVTTTFAVDALPANGLAGVSKALKDNLDTLVLDAGKAWSRPLRGAGREVRLLRFKSTARRPRSLKSAGRGLG